MDIIVTFALVLVLLSVFITPMVTVWLTLTLKEMKFGKPNEIISFQKDYIKSKERMA